MTCMIIPPYLLQKLATLDDPHFAPVAEAARASLARDMPIRGLRAHSVRATTVADTPRRSLAGPRRTIFDAGTTEVLPGRVVRTETQNDTADAAVDEAYAGLGHTHTLLKECFERASLDDRNGELHATVHFGERYDNAFWDGERMVFGDGDGIVFTRMTASLSVIGHELAHGLTQYSSNFVYEGQSGALNESVSDVFGALVEQYTLGQKVEEASWLIGAGLFTDEVQGAALRSLKAPGTAYNDDVLGVDPQPAHMDDYVDTRDDYGGVHLNSGIPNRAFYLAAAALGGAAWVTAGRVWYRTLVHGGLSSSASFAEFASSTVASAAELFGTNSTEADAVASAWDTVGVAA